MSCCNLTEWKRIPPNKSGKPRSTFACLLLAFACAMLLHPVAGLSAGGDFDGLLDLWSERLGHVRVTSSEQWQEKRMAIEEVLFDFLLPHPDELQPIDVVVLSEEDVGAYTRRKIEYSTLPGERVRAWLLIPHGATIGGTPAVLALHQTTLCGKDEVVGLGCDSELEYGLELVHRGYVVLAPDGITMGERISGAPFGDTRAVYRKFPHWSALGITIWENVQAVNVLVTVPEVDSTRIGCIGHSHGGYGTMFLAAFDPRVKAAVCSCGFMALCDDTNPFRWSRSPGFLFMPELRPYIKKRPFPFDFHEVLALAAPTPFLNISAYNDEVFPGSGESAIRAIDRVKEVYETIYGAGDRLANLVHSSGHAFPPSAKQEAYKWLDMWLKDKHTPNGPKEKQLLSVGTGPLEGPKPQVRVDSRERGLNVFSFSLKTRSSASLRIFDVTGRRIRTLIECELESGQHEVQWDGGSDDGKTVSPGIYFYRFESGKEASSGKVFVIR